MLEKEMTKDEILERYLNTIFFGQQRLRHCRPPPRCTSARASAAHDRRGRVPRRARSVRRRATTRSASRASKARFNAGGRTARRRRDGHQAEQDELIADLGAARAGAAHDAHLRHEPTYYTEALREYLLERSNILGDTEQERANLLYRGGLRIHTTLDPFLQRFAEEARNSCPNGGRHRRRVVSLDAKTARSGRWSAAAGFKRTRVSEINMALVPRQTGSSIKLFILAAAIQAGAIQPDDLIDGARAACCPTPAIPKNPFSIKGGVSGSSAARAGNTWLSLNCAFARLSQIVGLNRVVDTTYRMANSSYLYRGPARGRPRAVQPYASFATGATR
jgi:membrane peptidoglycan carboxypeptidase